MNNFQYWYSEIADIPTKAEDGTWYDLETGIAFDNSINYSKKARQSVSCEAKNFREIAKFFGGKALVGTIKQKEWAEKIRAEKIQEMKAEEAQFVCQYTNAKYAKFWIELRNSSAYAIFKTVSELVGKSIDQFILESKEKEIKRIALENDSFNILCKSISKELKMKWTTSSCAREANGITLEEAIKRAVNDKHHPSKQEKVLNINKIEIYVLDIPTLKKKQVFFIYNEKFYQGHLC